MGPFLPYKYYLICLSLFDQWSYDKQPLQKCPKSYGRFSEKRCISDCPCLYYSYQQRCDPSKCGNDKVCSNIPFPKNYIAYHLNGEKITIDGKLNDHAWREVPYSSKFVDLRGEKYPTPKFDTKVKVRWDDERLYVGAYLQAGDLFGTYKNPDDPVFFDNAFEVFFDADGSLHNYKEVQVNILNTKFDLSLKRAYMYARGERVDNVTWDSDLESAIYTDGVINDPKRPGTFWSVEMSISFRALAEHTRRVNSTPKDGEVFLMNFGRPEWKLKVVNGKYEKVGNTVPDADWWSWQETGAINLHVPGRWGAVQFSTDRRNRVFDFPKWHVYKALFDVAEALHVFRSIYGIFVEDVKQLALPRYITSGACVRQPEIKLNLTDPENPDFEVTIRSKRTPFVGKIRGDKHVTFNN